VKVEQTVVASATVETAAADSETKTNEAAKQNNVAAAESTADNKAVDSTSDVIDGLGNADAE